MFGREPISAIAGSLPETGRTVRYDIEWRSLVVDKNEISGGAKELGGKIKEGVGKLVGNERLQAEGAVDQAEGKTEKNYGKVKDAVKDQVGKH
jgi:uncharacterized protein YjbJ (UPF0337 family)